MRLAFRIRYVPGPKQSTRFNRFTKKVAYPDPRVVQDAESLIALLIPHRPTTPIDCGVRLTMICEYGWLKKHDRIRKTTNRVPKLSKPDSDQLAKQMMDVMERTGFFTNDSRVYILHAERWHGDNGPCTDVVIETDEP